MMRLPIPMVPHRPRPFTEQGRRIAAARDDRGQSEGRHFSQSDLARAIHANGHPRVPRQAVISEIERGYIDIPAAMRGPLLASLPDLILDEAQPLTRIAS